MSSHFKIVIAVSIFMNKSNSHLDILRIMTPTKAVIKSDFEKELRRNYWKDLTKICVVRGLQLYFKRIFWDLLIDMWVPFYILPPLPKMYYLTLTLQVFMTNSPLRISVVNVTKSTRKCRFG